MLLDLSKTIDNKKFRDYANLLISKEYKVSLQKIIPKRTIQQNKYLHVCITLFAIEFGYTLEESKTLLKRLCDFMKYEKNGNKFLKKTSLLDSGELTKFIEWIRNYAGMNGLYIPTSEEYISNRFEIDREIEKSKQYL